jgi:hypothetical protein
MRRLEARRARGRELVAGIKVGDTIRVTWSFENSPGPATHEGTVVELDDWLRCKPFSTSNGQLHIPISALTLVDRVELV